MNPAMTPCAAPPGYYGGPYMPSLNPGQSGYPYRCVPVPGSYPVPFPGYGGPIPQPFLGPPQPYPSTPCAYGPYPGMFPPGYMVPQQQYPQPCMYGGLPMPPPPLAHSQDGAAVQCPTMSTNGIPNNILDQEQRTGSALMRPGDDDSSCAYDLPTAAHQQQKSTVPSKCPPGFQQIRSGDISPASMQWNTMVSHDDPQVPGIPHTEDIEDRDQTDDSKSGLWLPSSEYPTGGCQTTSDIEDKNVPEGSSSELWLLSSEHSTAGCHLTPDSDITSNCQPFPDLTLDTQPPRSDLLPEHSNKSVVNALASSNIQMSSCEELGTDETDVATSESLTPPVQEEEPISMEETCEKETYPDSFSSDSNDTVSVPAPAVYFTTTTKSDNSDGTTKFTWNAASKDLHFTCREYLVCAFQYVYCGLCFSSGLPLENKCWVVPWPITLT
ncbi:eukaryotic translation initiation factor 4 gamma 3-like [Saccostrea cucullata]|uniref:eukaryotic translation initiation factor 4 gamma 3-like n=1 Tax=Saccostrea cuccullata TaxID=36930 RepID=UPI002ED58BB1